MSGLSVPETPDELTPAWLTAALSEAGALEGGSVAAADWKRVGAEYGFTSLIARVRLRYEGAHGDAPASLIAKLTTPRLFERSVREARFYGEIADAPAPHVFLAAVDETRRRVALLLEDLTGGRQGDVLRGCSIDDAVAVIDELAPFHARRWGARAPVRAFPQVGRDPQEREARYDGQVDAFLARYGGRLPAEVRALVVRLCPRLGDVLRELEQGPRTLVHGDLQLDNLLFEAGRDRSVVFLDWQTVSVGAPAWDVTLFLCGSLDPEDRRAAENELLDRYAALLAAHGVRGYGAGELRRDCLLALLAWLAGTVGWLTSRDASELVGRERAVQEAALADGRLVAALLDHDVEAALA
jgi:hypothetical protein